MAQLWKRMGFWTRCEGRDRDERRTCDLFEENTGQTAEYKGDCLNFRQHNSKHCTSEKINT